MALTIVMYHYVRDLAHSRYPDLKVRTTKEFSEQIQLFKQHYNIISGNELLDTLEGGEPLPPRALLLTFDDGYPDHFTQVMPILVEEKITGCFFPSAKPVLEHIVLDVNKIQFTLAAVENKNEIIEYIFQMLDTYHHRFDTCARDYYWEKLARKNRFDPKEIVFIKKILQRELPEELRKIIVDNLFKRFVTSDEVAFAEELYMNLDQIGFLSSLDMLVGSHSYDHYWLDSLSIEEQEHQLEMSLSFLDSVGSCTERWMMCYPYGAFNDSLLSVLSRLGCKAGVTVDMGIASLAVDSPLLLPRLDTNDLPIKRYSVPNEWMRMGV